MSQGGARSEWKGFLFVMTSWPVIVRELRAESRRSSNFGLRMTGAAAATAFLGLLLITDRTASPAQLGSRLFYSLNAVQFLLMALLVPAITADCISRERREGTLGLLFLTPLTPLGVVLGKWVIQALRSVALFASMLPILALPHLLGGVSSKDVAMSLLMNGSVMMLALSAGILASAFSKDWTNALVAAMSLGAFLIMVFMAIHLLAFDMLQFMVKSGNRLVHQAGAFPPWDWAWRQFESRPLSVNLTCMVSLSTGAQYQNAWGFELGWSQIWGNMPLPFQRSWLRLAGALAGASALTLAATLLMASWRVRQTWRQASSNRWVRWSYQAFCTPRFWRSVFHSKLRRALDRNPVGWLEQFSVGARITKWGWCLLVVLIECMLVMSPMLEGLIPGQYWIGGLLLGGLAFSASSSFRKEQETGAFELLLVTPLTERQIIFGRLRGVWAQFLPALAVLFIVFIPLKTHLGAWLERYGQEIHWTFIVQMIAGFLTLPLVGLRISMLPSLGSTLWLPALAKQSRMPARSKNRAQDTSPQAGRSVFVDWALCCLLGLALPYAVQAALTAFQSRFRYYQPGSVTMVLVGTTVLLQLVLAVLSWISLHRCLRYREFVLR